MNDFSLHSTEYRVICIYAHTSVQQRESFFHDCLPYLGSERCVIFMGDFNCICDARDRSGGNVVVDRSARLLETIVADCDLVDSGRLSTSSGALAYTRFEGSSHARLDRIYISVSLSQNVTKYSVTPVSFSDHCLVSVECGRRKRGGSHFNWGLWKLNGTLLKDKKFLESVGGCFGDMAVGHVSIFERWECFKEDVKMTAIERSIAIAFQARAKERQLEETLAYLCQLECQNPGVGTQDINYIKAQVNELSEIRYRGALIRARAQAYLLGEQPKKRSLARETRYALSREINAIESGPIVTTDKAAIEGIFVQHYRSLFSAAGTLSNPNEIRNLLERVPKLSDSERRALDCPIELDEIERAIDSLSSQKSPGPDGISAEFYKAFKSQIGPVLLNVFRHSYSIQRLPLTFLKTIRF